VEKEIIGKWILENGEMVPDSNCERIESLIQEELKEIKSSSDGWTKYYMGENDTIWELTYPKSHLQGGGPPTLKQIK